MEAPAPFRWREDVRVLRLCDDDHTVAELEPGKDLLLEIPRRWGDSLPDGLLLDDLLSQDARESLDRDAVGALNSWRGARDAHLTLDGTCLPEIWEQELLAEVFIPEMRIASGVRNVLTQAPVRRVHVDGMDAARVDCLRWVLAQVGVEVSASDDSAAPPSYPSAVAAPGRAALPMHIVRATLSRTGLPRLVRGSVYVMPYSHLRPVVDRLAASRERSLVLDPWYLPRTDAGTLARAAAHGGWVGHPGSFDRRRSHRRLAAAVAAARADPTQRDPLSQLLDSRALVMLERRAGDTLAIVDCMRRSFASGGIRVAVLPYDSPPDARSVISAARGTKVATLVVQHGFQNDPNESDKTLADAVAVWSEVDARQLEGRTAGHVTCTGNPGIESPGSVPQPRRQQPTGRTLVLVEYSSRLSTRVDNRISMRHVSTALRALAKARPGTAVMIRPHPAEHEPEIFAPLTSAHPEIDVYVDMESPIGTLIAASDLCVAAVSTAALEAGAAGVPVIHLNVTGRPARAPFDGSAGVPVATNAEELAHLVPITLASVDVPGRTQMLEALGVKVDAVDRVLELIRTLDGSPREPTQVSRSA